MSESSGKPSQAANICAKLVTVRSGRKEAIILDLTRPVTIGRNPMLSSYIVEDPLVSGVHCKLYAVRSPSGGVIVSCQDISRNGITLNGQHIRKTAIILMDGDVLRLPNSLEFTCIHLLKEPSEKLSLFDPTPPTNRVSLQKRIGRYVVMSQCLGTGSFATVHLAFDPVNHKQVACKSIRTKREHEISQVMKEVRILMTLKHPNINEIYDTEENNKFIHIFLQLCTGGDLFTYVSTANSAGSRLCEAESKYIMYQLLKGLEYLHNKHVSHRGPYPRILIADFGLARPNSYQETLNVCGTVSYLPPEGILALDNKHLGYVGMPADCWSAGVILYIMICGGHPFDNDSIHEHSCYVDSIGDPARSSSYRSCQFSLGSRHGKTQAILKERIVRGEVEFLRYPWDDLPEAKALVQALLVHNYLQRATVQMALKSHWILCELEDLQELYRRRILTTK